MFIPNVVFYFVKFYTNHRVNICIPFVYKLFAPSYFNCWLDPLACRLGKFSKRSPLFGVYLTFQTIIGHHFSISLSSLFHLSLDLSYVLNWLVFCNIVFLAFFKLVSQENNCYDCYDLFIVDNI